MSDAALASFLWSGADPYEWREAAMPSSLDERLANWGECWKSRRVVATAESLEGGYRNGRARAYDGDASLGRNGITIGVAPGRVVVVDRVDAGYVETAVCALDVFHHVMLKGHYVKEWKPGQTLHKARDAAGYAGGRGTSSGDYDAALAMARALVGGMVDRPAVIRRERAAARAMRMLELEAWT